MSRARRILFVALTIVLAIFGLVIGSVFRLFPSAIVPCVIQIPIAVVIGAWLNRKGHSLRLPSIIALALMYLTVIFGDVGLLHTINTTMADWLSITWVLVLLTYSYIASVLPVWTLLQPRDYINALQLISVIGLLVLGVIVAAFAGGAPVVAEGARPALAMAAPAFNPNPVGAPAIFPLLFITIACGAISGFHCLVSSGTSSKQLKSEPDARMVGYGAMLTEGFLATLVILACAAGIGMGSSPSHGRRAARSGKSEPGIAAGRSVDLTAWSSSSSPAPPRRTGGFWLKTGCAGISGGKGKIQASERRGVGRPRPDGGLDPPSLARLQRFRR